MENILDLHKYEIPPTSDGILPEGDSTNVKIVLPCLQQRCHQNPRNLYYTETAIEFHHLLVSTMLFYASSLRVLRKAHNTRRDEVDKKKKEKKDMSKMEAKLIK